MARLFTFRLSAAFAVIVSVVLALIPLLAVHGVESALALGVLLPPWVAATAASYTERNRGTRGIDLMLRAVGAGLFIWMIPVALLALSSLRVRQCAPAEGLAFMVLGPAIGCALAFETSQRLGLCSQEAPSRVRAHLKGMGMKCDLADIPGDLPDADGLIALMGQDKKVQDGRIAFIMARAIGDAFVLRDVDMDVVKSVLEEALAG